MILYPDLFTDKSASIGGEQGILASLRQSTELKGTVILASLSEVVIRYSSCLCKLPSALFTSDFQRYGISNDL